METRKSKKKEIGAKLDQLWSWYRDAVAYQNSIGLNKTIPECVRFYEGDQWPKATNATKHFPRPVINIIEMNCNNKKSQVLSSPVKIVYESESHKANTDKFNHFAEYQQGRLRQDDLNNKAILDGIIKGSYCSYFYWDDSIIGLDGLKEGDIAEQVVDPANVLFANPNEKDEQKQDWIMIVSRENVERIKQIADKGVDMAKITEDDNESIYNEQESETTKFATVITRFFRVNGEVYYERATKGAVFNKARPFTPDVEKYKKLLAGDTEETEAQPEKQENQFLRKRKATLYPIVFSSWKERDKSIYGRGEVEIMIPNQKAINWTLGLQILVAQNEGMSPVIVRPNALKGQKITNEPGQILTDYSNTQDGIKFPQKPQMSQASINLVDKMADLTRAATGSSEVMSGEVISAGMSGAAIAQLQSQALKPIEDLQRGYWRHMEKIGEVLEQFFRFFYKDKTFQYKDKENNIHNETFNSKEFENERFDVVAEAIAGTLMSDVSNINLLDGLFAKGAISIETYLKSYPENAIMNRQKLLDSIEAEQQEQVAIMSRQLQETQAQLQQAIAQLEEDKKAIDQSASVVNENRNLKKQILAIQAEYSSKIAQGNKILGDLMGKAKEYYSDAKSMANEVAKARGIAQMPNNTGSPSEML